MWSLVRHMPVTEGLDREVMDQVAAEVEKEIGVHFDLESEDTAAGVCQVKVTAVGTGLPCSSSI